MTNDVKITVMVKITVTTMITVMVTITIIVIVMLTVLTVTITITVMITATKAITVMITVTSIYHQHGFKTKHSTTTALHQLTNHITTGFNQKKPPHRTITIALDMSQAFDTVNHYTLIEKLINTNTPNLITRFIANYIRG